MDTIDRAINLYYLDNRALPASLDDLTKKGTGGEPFLLDVPNDPWGEPYDYIIVNASRRSYRISSYGADKVAGTDDDITYAPR